MIITDDSGTFAFRAALAELHLQQAGLAKMLGISARSVTRWYHGDLPVPRYVMVTLSLMNGYPAALIRKGRLKPYEMDHWLVFHRRSYKALALKFHPDKSGWDSTREMQIINGLRRT